MLIIPCRAGAAASKPTLAPLNPAFIEYQQKAAALDAKEPSTGRIPPPVDRSYDMGSLDSSFNRLELENLPEKYDLREENLVTPVKDQGSQGLCWAFGTYGSMESVMLKQEGITWDLSENHLGRFTSNLFEDGFDRDPGGGGDSYISAAYLSRWSGPVSDTDNPYNSPDNNAINLLPEKHVQEVMFLPNRSGPLC